MKKFLKFCGFIIAAIVAVGIISSIFAYNNRPLPFENQPRTPHPIEKIATDGAEKVSELGGKVADKIENFEMPEFDTKSSENPSTDIDFKDVTVGSQVADDYERSQFGSAWKDVDRNGCSTREDILARDLQDAKVEGKCKVRQGVLTDDYSGRTIEHKTGEINGKTYKSDVQIDHIIPLSYAYKQGGSEWSAAKKEKFANDPINLKAVQGSENMSKSDSGPADWMPTNVEYHCEYAKSFAKVAVEYKLNVAEADYKAMVKACR